MIGQSQEEEQEQEESPTSSLQLQVPQRETLRTFKEWSPPSHPKA